MADQVTFGDGNNSTPPDGTIVSTDDAGAAGHVQRVKLAYSADGVATHATVDADGVLVNLGTNNDVTVTGTVTANAGTNLNTSALATSANQTTELAHLAAIETAVEGTIAVSGTVAVTHAALTELGTAIDTELQVDVVGALPAGNNNIGDVDVASSALPTGASTLAEQQSQTTHLSNIATSVGTLDNAIAGNEMQVDVLTMPVVAVTQSGSWDEIGINDSGNSITVDGTITASNTAGDIAHDSGDSGNPVKVGAKAVTALAAVTANDRANAIADLFGRQLTAHIDPAMQTWKSYNATTSQTGSDVWSPASGKKIAVTSVVIGTYGTTAARLILWFGANADTTYSAGTDQLLLAASFAPSASTKPGLVFTPAVPVYAATVDHEIHITTDANLSVDIALYGYEF